MVMWVSENADSLETYLQTEASFMPMLILRFYLLTD